MFCLVVCWISSQFLFELSHSSLQVIYVTFVCFFLLVCRKTTALSANKFPKRVQEHAKWIKNATFLFTHCFIIWTKKLRWSVIKKILSCVSFLRVAVSRRLKMMRTSWHITPRVEIRIVPSNGLNMHICNKCKCTCK